MLAFVVVSVVIGFPVLKHHCCRAFAAALLHPRRPILLFGVYTGIATLCCPLMAAVKTEPSDEDKKVGDKAKTETSKIQPPRHRPGQHKVGPAHAADNNDDDLRDIEDFTNGSSSFRHSRLLAAMRLCCVRSDKFVPLLVWHAFCLGPSITFVCVYLHAPPRSPSVAFARARCSLRRNRRHSVP